MKKILKCGCQYDEDETGRGLKMCKKHQIGYVKSEKENGATYIDEYIDAVLKEDERSLR